MADVRYEKLDRIREDIKRDKAKVAKLQEQIKVKEAKLKEAEASKSDCCRCWCHEFDTGTAWRVSGTYSVRQFA